jgi:hypothetical protein
MDTLKLDFKNCYGIGNLEHEFDFSTFKTNLIYASNGVMKTSFANTFKAISEKRIPVDRLYNKPSFCQILVDGNIILSDSICVIKSIDQIDTVQSQSKLLVDENSKKEYDSIYSEIHDKKTKLISDLNRLSGVKRVDLEETIKRDFNIPDFFPLLSLYQSKSMIDDFSKVKYTEVFNDDVLAFLSIPDVRKNIQEYNKTYNELIEKSSIFQAGVFNPTKAEKVFDILKDQNFFHAKHKIKLQGIDQDIESAEELNQILLNERKSILENENLLKIEQQIKKAAVHSFRTLLETHDIISELANLNEFKIKL